VEQIGPGKEQLDMLVWCPGKPRIRFNIAGNARIRKAVDAPEHEIELNGTTQVGL